MNRSSNAVRAMALIVAGLLLAALMSPPAVNAQVNPLTAITTTINTLNQSASGLLNFLRNFIRPVLEGARSSSLGLQNSLGQLRNLWEQTVWPSSDIVRARTLAQQLIGLFRLLLNDHYGTGVNSAQLPNPIRLEGIVRNRQTGDHPQLVSAFRQTYGSVPPAASAHPEERSLIDVDDALAIDQLMALKLADAAADQILRAAEAIENETTRLAPGTAAMVSATAYLAALQSQAHVKKMIAGQLRQEAARLAHDTMSLKRAAAFTRESRTTITELNR